MNGSNRLLFFVFSCSSWFQSKNCSSEDVGLDPDTEIFRKSRKLPCMNYP